MFGLIFQKKAVNTNFLHTYFKYPNPQTLYGKKIMKHNNEQQTKADIAIFVMSIGLNRVVGNPNPYQQVGYSSLQKPTLLQLLADFQSAPMAANGLTILNKCIEQRIRHFCSEDNTIIDACELCANEVSAAAKHRPEPANPTEAIKKVIMPAIDGDFNITDILELLITWGIDHFALFSQSENMQPPMPPSIQPPTPQFTRPMGSLIGEVVSSPYLNPYADYTQSAYPPFNQTPITRPDSAPHEELKTYISRFYQKYFIEDAEQKWRSEMKPTVRLIEQYATPGGKDTELLVKIYMRALNIYLSSAFLQGSDLTAVQNNCIEWLYARAPHTPNIDDLMECRDHASTLVAASLAMLSETPNGISLLTVALLSDNI